MINKVKKYIEDNRLFERGAHIITALSGGADSVCLFRILVSLREEYNLNLYAVHVNHGIRGEEADRDEEYSKALADKYGVPFKTYYYDIPALSIQWKMTEEEAGRKARYEAFEKECIERNADFIAVAHHMNDQAETLLFRMCRGTGIKGLCGIPSKRDNIIRPLLCISRQQIEEYLSRINQEYVTDSTNENSDYDRNRIRSSVVPGLCEVNSQAVEHICETAQQASQIYHWFEKSCEDVYGLCVERKDNSLYLKADAIEDYPDIVKTHIIRKMIENLITTLKDVEKCHIIAVLELIGAKSGKRINLPYSLIAEKQYEYIRIYRDGSDYTKCDVPDYVPDITFDEARHTFYNVYIPERKSLINELVITYKLKKYNNNVDIIPKNSCIKWIECDKINRMLKIRQIQSEDYFLLDDGKKKKLSRYMIDEKIPRQYRDNLLVVADGSNVLYVIGGRMGKGCYVNETTDNILEIKYLL